MDLHMERAKIEGISRDEAKRRSFGLIPIHRKEQVMSESERQFREHGWTRTASCMFRWEHPLHGTLYLDPDTREQMMDVWITGFVAGKEHNNAQ